MSASPSSRAVCTDTRPTQAHVGVPVVLVEHGRARRRGVARRCSRRTRWVHGRPATVIAVADVPGGHRDRVAVLAQPWRRPQGWACPAAHAGRRAGVGAATVAPRALGPAQPDAYPWCAVADRPPRPAARPRRGSRTRTARAPRRTTTGSRRTGAAPRRGPARSAGTSAVGGRGVSVSASTNPLYTGQSSVAPIAWLEIARVEPSSTSVPAPVGVGPDPAHDVDLARRRRREVVGAGAGVLGRHPAAVDEQRRCRRPCTSGVTTSTPAVAVASLVADHDGAPRRRTCRSPRPAATRGPAGTGSPAASTSSTGAGSAARLVSVHALRCSRSWSRWNCHSPSRTRRQASTTTASSEQHPAPGQQEPHPSNLGIRPIRPAP